MQISCRPAQTKKFYKLVKKGAKDKIARRGVKEVGPARLWSGAAVVVLRLADFADEADSIPSNKCAIGRASTAD